MFKTTFSLFAMLLVSSFTFGQTKSYNWDAVHSNINFEVDYLGISEATGRFTASEGSLSYSKDDFSDAQISVSADVSSINTDNEKRDGHLKAPDFFDVTKYPSITFKSTKFKAAGKNKYKVSGTLTMKGVTKEIVTDATYLGERADAYGQVFSLWKVNFTVNRQDYGVSFNKTNAAGDYVLGDDVRMSINAKFIKS